MKEGTLEFICGRCFDNVSSIHPSSCDEKPELFKNMPMGMYHCPDCGTMILAGSPHPFLCRKCINEIETMKIGVTNG